MNKKTTYCISFSPLLGKVECQGIISFFPINFILQLKFKLLLKALATFSISGVQYADIKYATSLRVIYLHCTVTLTVAIAGVPTPLLAVH